MKRMFMVLALVSIIMCGCATYQIPSGATAAEKKAALCSDAQMGYALSQAMLDRFITSPESRQYWEAYKAGVELALKMNCM